MATRSGRPACHPLRGKRAIVEQPDEEAGLRDSAVLASQPNPAGGTVHSVASQAASTSSSLRKRRLEIQAAEQRAKVRRKLLEEKEKVELELIDERLELEIAQLEEGTNGGSSDRSSLVPRPDANQGCSQDNNTNRSIRAWLEKSSAHVSNFTDNHRETSVNNYTRQIGGQADQAERNATAASSHYQRAVDSVPNMQRNETSGISKLTDVLSRTIEAIQGRSATGDSSRQLLNRLTSKGELPIFNGDTVEWARFKRVFDLTTQKGGYSEEENVSRLYACLRGPARDAVASLMVTASDVRQIMETLELRFGNPDVVATKIVEDIKNLPRIGGIGGNLVTFATTVKNCVAALQAVNHIGYLQSPDLNSEILRKLPMNMIYQYNRFLNENNEGNEPKLVVLAKFLFFEAEIACKAGTSNLITPNVRYPREGKLYIRDKTKRTAESKATVLTATTDSSKILSPNRKIVARTIRSLSLPSQTLHVSEVKKHRHLKDLNIEGYSNVTPEILIGQDHWDLITSLEVRESGRQAPVASYTNLGWTIHGHLPCGANEENELTMLQLTEMRERNNNHFRDSRLNELVKHHFNIESLGVSEKPRNNVLIVRAEKILKKTTRRVNDRWETGLLWRSDAIEFPNNKQYAVTRLKSLERKMDKDPKFAAQYCEQIQHFLDCGYASKVILPVVNDTRVWYLPHFGVRNVNKPEKLRVVFDAAAVYHGTCLNDALLPGPDMLNSLLGSLLRFRQKRIAFTADIKEMFLQIKIRPENQFAQHFLWRGMDRAKEPDVYVMTFLIFGATSSPCSAQFVKNVNAKELELEYPKAAEAIMKYHYMDDYIDGADTIEEAVKLIREVTEIHRRGGFDIRNWTCNSRMVLDSLPSEKRSRLKVNLAFDQHPTERVLGIKWNPDEDRLSFNLSLKRIQREILTGEQKPTKRQMLSVIMSVFDPYGFLSPFTIRSKILLQNSWRSTIAWDEVLKDTEYVEWKRWIQDLQHIKHFSIPRCYLQRNATICATELHVFCDASEKAYAGVAYWRDVYEDGITTVTFILGKCRVSPLKPISIPRLELQAALLASRIARTVQQEHSRKITKRVFWTDSCTVLSWLRSDYRTYKAFVAHRLGEIDDLTSQNEWQWIPSKENPADDATRENGPMPLEKSRWISGPEFLRNNERFWHAQPRTTVPGPREELRPEFVGANVDFGRLELPQIERFSSWFRLIRSTAWLLVFSECCLAKKKVPLTNVHVQWAVRKWSAQCQRDSFSEELHTLNHGGVISCKSRLHQLTPFLDEVGLIRLGGRISAAEGVPHTMKEPVILDGGHRYTRLLILHYHQKANHGSTETVVNELRQSFWILRLRPTVKTVASRCQVCRMNKKTPQIPRMADLPSVRIDHHVRPFTNCGIDYFGPMEVTVGRRREKRWGVLFTCLNIRAIHIEIASTLTTDATIMALSRMAARRGFPTIIYSDNGTNLRGAHAELKRLVTDLDCDTLRDRAMSKGVEWRFIPPGAPHMGGCWESLVKSVKITLRIILKERAPREETLATMLAEAEHTVNSRPLTSVSVDHRDGESLTPNHFLIGTSSINPLAVGLGGREGQNLRKQWRIAQNLADHFWSRWVKEYLPTLIKRRRWHQEVQPLAVGDLVLIVDSQLPRNIWPRGIVTTTFPGRDGRVRVAEIKTTKGKIIRPVSKLIVLKPMDISAE
ncbi:uncharacterized protein LOC143350669 [Colletes latitarsis]|uniref:uncharacterized protein LOC143350669 n=1 Tax=Colletes latitarsis TaxID=2605962 RepID=UPI00403663B8